MTSGPEWVSSHQDGINNLSLNQQWIYYKVKSTDILVIFATMQYDLYIALFHKKIKYYTGCTLVSASSDPNEVADHQS